MPHPFAHELPSDSVDLCLGRYLREPAPRQNRRFGLIHDEVVQAVEHLLRYLDRRRWVEDDL